ncbi:hypothetical protein GQ55_7G000600, partial [Panicum hallii var. hallii]
HLPQPRLARRDVDTYPSRLRQSHLYLVAQAPVYSKQPTTGIGVIKWPPLRLIAQPTKQASNGPNVKILISNRRKNGALVNNRKSYEATVLSLCLACNMD